MIIGIDEVGRGPGAGPIVFCAFALLDEKTGAEILSGFPKGILHDSKKLTEMKREGLSNHFHTLKKDCRVYWTLSERSASDIDEKGLALCIQECLAECAESLLRQRGAIIEDILFKLDGSLHLPKGFKQETIIKGDEKILEIACASIVAKVYRDTLMKNSASGFPLYGFEKNKGYLSKEHILALKKYGATPFHRRSFLKKILSDST